MKNKLLVLFALGTFSTAFANEAAAPEAVETTPAKEEVAVAEAPVTEKVAPPVNDAKPAKKGKGCGCKH